MISLLVRAKAGETASALAAVTSRTLNVIGSYSGSLSPPPQNAGGKPQLHASFR